MPAIQILKGNGFCCLHPEDAIEHHSSQSTASFPESNPTVALRGPVSRQYESVGLLLWPLFSVLASQRVKLGNGEQNYGFCSLPPRDTEVK